MVERHLALGRPKLYHTPDAKREAWNAYHRKWRFDLRKAVIEGYGGKCVCCGETSYEFLCIDHVNGGGNQERQRRTTNQILQSIKRENFPDTYRVLCANCNQALGCFGKCPHGV